MARKRGLLLVYRLPWPPAAGGSLRDWQNVVALSGRVELSVVALDGRVVPRPPDLSLRLWTTLDSEALREPKPFDGSEAVLEPDWWRNDLGYPTDFDWSPFRAAALRRLLDANEFDFAVIEDIVYWRYAEIVQRSCDVVIDYHNVQSRIDAEQLAFTPRRYRTARKRAEIALRTMLEVEQSYRDVPAIVCSQAEKGELIARGFAAERIAVIHNTVSMGEERDRGRPLEFAAQRILFAGMMDYQPNADAALDLITKILPRVRNILPDAELWIVGMNPRPELLRAASRSSGVHITGMVADTEPYFRDACVLSVPLTVGGGTRFKIVEAFQYSLPVVSSPKGCEGLEVVAGRHLLIARTPAEHAKQLIAVLRDRELATRLAAEGHHLCRDRYSFATAARQWDDCLRRFAICS